jgi:hypothetical protein
MKGRAVLFQYLSAGSEQARVRTCVLWGLCSNIDNINTNHCECSVQRSTTTRRPYSCFHSQANSCYPFIINTHINQTFPRFVTHITGQLDAVRQRNPITEYRYLNILCQNRATILYSWYINCLSFFFVNRYYSSMKAAVLFQNFCSNKLY